MTEIVFKLIYYIGRAMIIPFIIISIISCYDSTVIYHQYKITGNSGLNLMSMLFLFTGLGLPFMVMYLIDGRWAKECGVKINKQ